jgi:hypothetical protein
MVQLARLAAKHTRLLQLRVPAQIVAMVDL